MILWGNNSTRWCHFVDDRHIISIMVTPIISLLYFCHWHLHNQLILAQYLYISYFSYLFVSTKILSLATILAQLSCTSVCLRKRYDRTFIILTWSLKIQIFVCEPSIYINQCLPVTKLALRPNANEIRIKIQHFLSIKYIMKRDL